jgi:hypothetical protein
MKGKNAVPAEVVGDNTFGVSGRERTILGLIWSEEM